MLYNLIIFQTNIFTPDLKDASGRHYYYYYYYYNIHYNINQEQLLRESNLAITIREKLLTIVSSKKSNS